MICIICEKGDTQREGIIEIKDAKQYPQKYNGKMLCREHYEDREYMKENDN